MNGFSDCFKQFVIQENTGKTKSWLQKCFAQKEDFGQIKCCSNRTSIGKQRKCIVQILSLKK